MQYAFHAIRNNFRARIQYRLSFFLDFLSQFIMTLGDLLAVTILMTRFSSLGQWSREEVLLFFACMQISFAAAEAINRGLTRTSALILDGSLDAMLLRPRGIAMQLVLSDFDPRRLGSIAVGLIVLFRVLPSLSITWSALNVLLFIFAIIGCVFLLMGLFFLDAAFCFVTLRSTEAVNVLTYGGRTCCQYPVDIYPGPLKVLFLYLAPLGLCLHVPLAALLGKPLSPLPPLSPAVSLLCSLLGPLFFACMYLLFRLALHRYASAGA